MAKARNEKNRFIEEVNQKRLQDGTSSWKSTTLCPALCFLCAMPRFCTPVLWLFLALSCLFGLVAFRFPHPYYVSMTEIEWNPKEKNLEIAVRMFTDDLELALRSACSCPVDLGSSSQSAQNQERIRAYLKQHLRIRLGRNGIVPQFVGMEKVEESTWIYLEFPLASPPEKLRVENDLLYESRAQQINFVRFRTPGRDETRQVRNPESVLEF